MALTNKITAIADAIRRKNGETTKYTMPEMVTAIDALPTGGGDDALFNMDASGNVTGKATTINGFMYNTTLASCKSILSAIGRGSVSAISASFPKCSTLGSAAFCSASSLATVDFPVCTSIGKYAFYQCGKLNTINFPACTTINTGAFYQGGALTTVNFPACTNIGVQAFYNSTGITTVDLAKNCTISSSAFYSCSKLTIFILRDTSAVSTLAASDAFNNTPIKSGTGYIYVPDDLVDSYKAATNWSVYAAQIKPLSELPA